MYEEGYYEKLVPAAADWLDLNWNSDEMDGVRWYDVIDVSILELADTCRCICGQLGVAVARQFGIETRGTERDYIYLRNQAPITGYSILTWHGSSIERCGDPEIEQLKQTMLKVIPEMPESVVSAMSGNAPNRFWIAEIENRRIGDTY